MIEEITDYTIQTSLFDCIGFAVFRFIVLEIVYAGFQLRHWWPSLLTMILSTLFMVAKCFVSLNTPDEIKPDEPTFTKYAVILVGIIASWVEVCFLDFKGKIFFRPAFNFYYNYISGGPKKKVAKSVTLYTKKKYSCWFSYLHFDMYLYYSLL